MMVKEKIKKIAQLEKELEDWSEFARIMKSKIEYVNSRHNDYWSVLYHIQKLFGKEDLKNNHKLGATLNNELELLQLNYNFAIKKVTEIEKQIIEL